MNRDPAIKGADAERLLNDALLKEAFDALDKAFDERALACPAKDDEGRRRLMDARVILRKVEGHLKKVAFEGKKAAQHAAKDIAPMRRWF